MRLKFPDVRFVTPAHFEAQGRLTDRGEVLFGVYSRGGTSWPPHFYDVTLIVVITAAVITLDGGIGIPRHRSNARASGMIRNRDLRGSDVVVVVGLR